MRSDRAVSYRIAMTLIVDRQTPVKTLPSLAVGKNATLMFLRSSLCFQKYVERLSCRENGRVALIISERDFMCCCI